ncbi:MAG: hypothetical protein E4H10_02025 [Bacteroidia bacterium]|nr:MAG: hypothetical protein E4H10_02025 [Bacteroidia bacterium]
MIWYILISLLLVLFLWLLLVPVIIYTNTDRNRYFLTLPGIFRAVVVPSNGLFHIRVWVFFIPFKFNPFEGKKEKRKPKPRVKKKRIWRSGNIRMMTGALRAFRVRRLEADIDTDDFTLNAWLVPVFSAVNGENIRLQVNFEGHQSLLLDLRVTLGALLWTFIKTKYRSINH